MLLGLDEPERVSEAASDGSYSSNQVPRCPANPRHRRSSVKRCRPPPSLFRRASQSEPTRYSKHLGMESHCQECRMPIAFVRTNPSPLRLISCQMSLNSNAASSVNASPVPVPTHAQPSRQDSTEPDGRSGVPGLPWPPAYAAAEPPFTAAGLIATGPPPCMTQGRGGSLALSRTTLHSQLLAGFNRRFLTPSSPFIGYKALMDQGTRTLPYLL